MVLSMFLDEGVRRPSLGVGDKVSMSRRAKASPHSGSDHHGTILNLKNSVATVKWHDGDVEEIHIHDLHPHGLLEPV